jgi:hypothetical protein
MEAAAAAANSSNGDSYHERMRILLNEHPFCKMTGIKIAIADVSVTSTAVTWTEEEVTCLQQADVACFDTTQAVRTYLDILDKQIHDYTLVDASILDEGRRKLPNKPCLGERSSNDASIIPAITSSASTSMTPSLMMAACPNFNTAKVCLDSGRWTSNHIYYPKDTNTQQGVELKVLPITNNNNDVHSIDDANMIENVNFEIWADSIVQAAGDVMERKFWGGGW